MEELKEIQVQFVTKLADAAVPETSFAVPVRLTRYGLSGVVNHLLGLEPPRPFDFLIDSTFLRTSLAQYLTAHNVSAVRILALLCCSRRPTCTLNHSGIVCACAGVCSRARVHRGTSRAADRLFESAPGLGVMR